MTFLHDKIPISKNEVKCQIVQQQKRDYCVTEQGNDLRDAGDVFAEASKQ